MVADRIFSEVALACETDSCKEAINVDPSVSI